MRAGDPGRALAIRREAGQRREGNNADASGGDGLDVDGEFPMGS